MVRNQVTRHLFRLQLSGSQSCRAVVNIHMIAKLRVARATNDLKKITAMYQYGLGLQVLGAFKDHSGFDGVILGKENAPYHLEFTQQVGFAAPNANSPETLLVFYIPIEHEWELLKSQMLKAGFILTPSHNPYWDEHGCTFCDPEGYRVVLCKHAWNR